MLNDHDIFVNAVGGIRALEPAVDLGIVASIISSFSEKTIPFPSMIFGEVGLSGEVRPVMKCSERINEAIRLGYKRIIGPGKNLDAHRFTKQVKPLPVNHIRELTPILFD
jgi:DNA repair protein RadA/Sms